MGGGNGSEEQEQDGQVDEAGATAAVGVDEDGDDEAYENAAIADEDPKQEQKQEQEQEEGEGQDQEEAQEEDEAAVAEDVSEQDVEHQNAESPSCFISPCSASSSSSSSSFTTCASSPSASVSALRAILVISATNAILLRTISPALFRLANIFGINSSRTPARFCLPRTNRGHHHPFLPLSSHLPLDRLRKCPVHFVADSSRALLKHFEVISQDLIRLLLFPRPPHLLLLPALRPQTRPPSSSFGFEQLHMKAALISNSSSDFGIFLFSFPSSSQLLFSVSVSLFAI